MSQDQARIYDAVGLCSGSNALMLQAVLVDHIGHATNAAQEFSAAIANFCRSWSTVSFRIKQTPEGVGQLEGFASDLSTLLAERVAALNSLTEMPVLKGDSPELLTMFRASVHGTLLTQAWRALLDGDTETLARMVSYAPDALSKSLPAEGLFYKLVKDAGIVLIPDGSASGVFRGSRRSSWTFVIGRVGLRVAYVNDFDTDTKRDDRTYTVSVVEGDVSPDGYQFKTSSAPVTEPEKVKLHATAVGAKLREAYSLKTEVQQ